LGEEYKLLNTSFYSFLHSPLTSSLLRPNIQLSTLFSNTFRLRSSLNKSDQVSRPCKKKQVKLYFSLFHRAFWFIKFYSHQLMHFLIQLRITNT
jgi:hypothetical protein